jgi:hypothetical protein
MVVLFANLCVCGALALAPAAQRPVTAVVLQQPFVRDFPITQDPVCPFTAPRLLVNDPAEVAWAASQLGREDASKPKVISDLLTALRTQRGAKGESAELAVLHLLHAAYRLHVPIPAATWCPLLCTETPRQSNPHGT